MAVKIVAADGNQSPTSDQRMARGNDGRLWYVRMHSTPTIAFYYSDDAGDTWSAATGSAPANLNAGVVGLFVDSDGNLHLTGVENGATDIAYWFGTVSAGAITWSARLDVESGTGTGGAVSRIVAFPYDTGWKAFILYTNSGTGLSEVTISGAGSPSLTAQHTIGNLNSMDLDFHHTGDGLTPDADPHIYVVASNHANSLRFIKVAHSSGTWTAGTTRTISSSAVIEPRVRMMGDNVYIAGEISDSINLWVRDTADTTTTSKTASGSLGTISNFGMAVDDSENVYVAYSPTADNDVYYRKWVESTDTWDSAVELEDAVTVASNIVEFQRGYFAGGLGVSWVDTGATPDDHWYSEAVVFTSAPTWDSPDEGASERRELELVLDWTFNDPGVGATQTAYTLKRVVDATTTTYWNGDGWQASEDGSTKISSTTSAHTLSQNWALPAETQHVYSVKTWDDTDSASDFSDGLTIYPSSIASINKGLSLPRPWKRQSDLLATLKANNDYLLAWVNNYIPSYGNANQDLTLRAGIRTSNQSQLRDVFPPVIGSYSVGNGTSYFENLGATNVYRTNELALSSRKSKNYLEKHLLPEAVSFVRSVPVTTWSYKDKKRMGDAKHRFGLTAEDVIDAVYSIGLTPKDSALVFNNGKDEDGDLVWYLNTEQLIPILWQAVQELSEEVFKLQRGKKNITD